MPNNYNNIQWVVQQNLTNQHDLAALKLACQKYGIAFVEVFIIPFTASLPVFNTSRKSIFYGSTTFNSLVAADNSLNRGLFFDAQTFSIENYLDKWGRHMLNFGAIVTSFRQLMANNYDAEKLFFIRPDDDSKSFSGEVKKFGEIRDWYDKLKMFDNTNLSADSKIVVSQPYNIQYEWRLWIVNRKVIAASKYREYFTLTKEEGCPKAVTDFAEKRCEEYTPHHVFVMDICLCGDEYFIVECGCMNGAGFYKANIEAIVKGVSDYFVGQGRLSP